MNKPAHAAPNQDHVQDAALPSARDRELLDYLIDRAWRALVRDLSQNAINDNDEKKHAA